MHVIRLGSVASAFTTTIIISLLQFDVTCRANAIVAFIMIHIRANANNHHFLGIEFHAFELCFACRFAAKLGPIGLLLVEGLFEIRPVVTKVETLKITMIAWFLAFLSNAVIVITVIL